MSDYQEIKEYLELDKDIVELAEGLASISYRTGETIGRKQAAGEAWQTVVGVLLETLKDKRGNKKIRPVVTIILKNYMDSTKSNDNFKFEGSTAEILKDCDNMRNIYLEVLETKVKRLIAKGEKSA